MRETEQETCIINLMNANRMAEKQRMETSEERNMRRKKNG
jgi:hypothetical protein